MPPRALLRRGLFVGLLALLTSFGGPGGHACAEDPPVPLVPPLSTPITDPTGRVEGLLREAWEAVQTGAHAHAVDLMTEAHAPAQDVLVETWPGTREWPALRLPALRRIELVAAKLPPPWRAQLSQRIHGGAIALARSRAEAGDLVALERLARAPILDAAGEEALLVLGDLALERGQAARAIDLWRRWEDLEYAQPGDTLRDEVATRAVATRIVAAAAMLGDEAELARRSAPWLDNPGGTLPDPVPLPASSVAARARLAALRAAAPRPSAEVAAPLPTRLSLAWWRDLADPDLRGAPDGGDELVMEALAADEEMLLLHDGRRVRRLDPLTGRERWAFPPGPLGWEHDPRSKYEPHDLPLRCVERHGDLVLAVLGDPGGTGAYAQGELQLDIDTGTRESRARLVALDAATGALRWYTGALRESHPVLGDRATCCASPPLVVGDDVYVLFARRVGVAEIYAACLERSSGRPRWVRFVAAAESGRDPAVATQGGRDERARVRAVPWGQRPTLAEGELCLVPHAGLAAGLDPAQGEVRWVRALPRFPAGDVPRERWLGASARNAPLAVPGAWVLAPMDGPLLVALERGSGHLRWHAPLLAEGLPPAWRDLLALGRDGTGRPVVRVVGAAPALLDPFHGALLATGSALAQDDPDGATMGGRALDLGSAVALLEAGQVRVQPWPGVQDPASGSTVELAAVASSYGSGGAPGDPGFAAWGDLARVGPLWFALEPRRLSAWIEDPGAAEVLTSAAARAPTDAALLATAGVLLRDPGRLVAALQAVDRDPGAAAVVADALARHLEAFGERGARDELAWSLRAALPTLPGPARDRIYRAGADHLRAAERWDDLVAWLGSWIDAAPVVSPAAWLTPPSAASHVEAPLRLRGDLYAARELRALRKEPRAAAALARREAEVEARSAAASASGDPAVVRAALRSAIGTRAIATLRAARAERAAADGDPARAARLAADLRLDPGLSREGREPQARADAALWQLREAGWLADAGDVEGARALLEDLRRWVPSGLVDPQGRTTTALLDRLRAEHGWAPRRGPDVREPLALWPGESGPLNHDRRGSIRVPGLVGPGAARSRDRFLLCRGLEVEIWSLAAGERVASLESGDGGWFGGTLQDAMPWLPERGVRIVTTVAGEPADRAAFRGGDWLLAWDGAPVDGMADLMRRIAVSEPGRALDVTLVRDGVTSTQRFTPGQRPAEEARDVLERPRAWVDAQGRAYVPTRVGLLRVDLEQAAATRLWTHVGPGTVQSVDVVGGQVLIAVRRLHDDDLLVALDPRDGRERWRADVPGPIEGVTATGSALVVRLGSPVRALLLDAEDGTARAQLELREPLRTERRAVLPERTTSGSQAGRLYALVPQAVHAGLVVLNTTTLEAPFHVVEGGRRGQRFGFDPQLSVGAYVGLLQGPSQIALLEPDPLGEGFLRKASLLAGDLLTEQLHHGGELDHESRVLVSGETIYVVRYQPRYPGGPQRGATVMTFGRIEDSKGRLRWTILDTEPAASRALGELYVTHLEVHPDGLLVSTLTRQPESSGAYGRSVLWVPSAEGGASERSGSPHPWEVAAVVPRRAAPARVGGALLLLTDDGARALPLQDR